MFSIYLLTLSSWIELEITCNNFSWIRVLSGQVGGDFFKVDGSGSEGCIVTEGSGLFSLGKNWKWKWQKCILTKPLCLPWKVASKTFWRSWLNLLAVKSYRQPCRYQGEGLELKVQVTDISSWPHGYNASHGIKLYLIVHTHRQKDSDKHASFIQLQHFPCVLVTVNVSPAPWPSLFQLFGTVKLVRGNFYCIQLTLSPFLHPFLKP